MIDVKKLITGFLILATAAVCSGLIFSTINLSPTGSPVAANAASGITIGANDAAANTGNAFLPTESQVEEAAAVLAPDLASSTMMVSSTDPSNLTDDLATEFVNGIVSANPTGPTGTDADGNPTFNPPDPTSIAANIAYGSAAQGLSTPDWDAEAAAIPVTVVPSSAAALTSYGTAVIGDLNDHLNSQAQSIVSDQTDSADTNDIAYLSSQIQGTLQDVASLKTPAPAEAYQKSLLTDLVYQKNILQLYTLAQTDPVKASILLQQEEPKFSSAQQDFSTQAQDLESNVLSLEQVAPTPHENGNIVLSFVNNTFGVPEAHALLPVFDPVTWGLIGSESATEFGDQLMAILKNTLLQILKNTLIALVQSKVLKWVQGSGAPRFVTNWGTTLINTAQQSAINALNSDMTSGCSAYSAFAPQITVTLKSFYLPASNSACANQFAAALGANSFQQFYNHFQNGGFVAFGASTLPSTNPFSSQFFEAQKTDLAYHNQQAASALQTQTSQGFKGDQICGDNSNPSGSTTYCETPDGISDGLATGGSCPAGDKVVPQANNGLCANGDQPVITTPSAVTGFTLQNTTGATYQQISAANDIVGLINSVLSSLVLGLANAAVNAVGQVVNQSLMTVSPAAITSQTNISGVSTSTVGGISTSNNPGITSLPLACSPSTQTIPSPSAGNATSTGPASTSTTPVSLSATGGTLDANDNQPIYYWSDSNGATSTGQIFFDSFPNPGTYTVTLTDSTGDPAQTCTVTQQ